MKISYAITLCNEIKEIQFLLDHLLLHKRKEDEIVILLDEPKAPPELLKILGNKKYKSHIYVVEGTFRGDFSLWKNTLSKFCSNDYIFNIDADEYPSETLIKNLPTILKENPTIKAFALPRVNTVEGLTKEHIQKWRWNISEKGWINYPDYQLRIYKRDHLIQWEGKVHETLNIRNEAVPLPYDTEDWVLYHPKQIERQEKQNNYYDTL